MFGFSIYINCKPSTLIHKDPVIVFENFNIQYSSLSKFKNDTIFTETEDLIIGLDGVILNLQKLKNTFAISDLTKLIRLLYYKYTIQFVSLLKGEFSGFILNKKTKKLVVFNNKTATKQVLYSKFKDCIVISPSLQNIIHVKEQLHIQSALDISSCYDMLTYGAMIENKTLIKGVYKLNAGEYLDIKHIDYVLHSYHSFNHIDYSIHSKKEAIDKLNDTFISALKLEYEKDKEYNYNYLATLSGGLDSRMNVMIAHQLGYKNHTFCFSQPNYLDEKIARKIAQDLNLHFDFYSLEQGNHLRSLEKIVSINNGLQYYLGASHYDDALEHLNLTPNYGLMHTGQIGDGVLGGFVTDKKIIQPKIVSSKLANKSRIDTAIIDKYTNEEVFKLYQRVFNLTNFGSFVTEQYNTYLVSPFLDDDFIKVALSIDPKLKHQQAIYIDWINTYHKNIAKYTWERTGFRPNKNWKYNLSRYTKKIKKEFYQFINKTEQLDMSPDNYYYNRDKTTQVFFNDFFNKNIERVYDNTALFKDMSLLFHTGNITEKSMVLTVLEIIRKFELTV